MAGSSERFGFGDNWTHFLETVDEERIQSAVQSLQQKLEIDSLNGKRFLDIGSGSGLFSLAARRLGALVHSFDYDPQSVMCTLELKHRYAPADPHWTVERGDVLDSQYVRSLGQYDIVYSWGVLHHTGAMWQALENAMAPLTGQGTLFIAIYNDQGGASKRWTVVKRLYNRCWRPIQIPLVAVMGLMFELKSALGRLVRLQNPLPFKDWAARKGQRGMSIWHDLVDWIGGYPFEVAKPEEIFQYYRRRGFVLTTLTTCGGGLGCNEYVFHKAN